MRRRLALALWLMGVFVWFYGLTRMLAGDLVVALLFMSAAGLMWWRLDYLVERPMFRRAKAADDRVK